MAAPLPTRPARPPTLRSACQRPDPLARDLARFPPAAVASAGRDFARMRRDWLQGQRNCFGGAALCEAVRDQQWRFHCWDELADAVAGGDRRAALDRLRLLLGDDDFRLGRMPEPAEWGQFSRID